jgi:hypothetical protein
VVQQARPADADLVGDLGQARAGVAVIGEPLERDLEDELLGRRRRRRLGIRRGSGNGHV